MIAGWQKSASSLAASASSACKQSVSLLPNSVDKHSLAIFFAA
jgi:hypothetical protein